jgi:hypothetical protein
LVKRACEHEHQPLATTAVAAQRLGIAAGHRDLRPLWATVLGAHAGVLCQEVRALRVDAILERVLRDALTPDQIASLLADLNLHNTSIDLLIALPTLRLTALPFLVGRARLHVG